MKFGLLISNSYNLGDEIQAIAARRLLPRIDILVNREKLWDSVDKGVIKLIMNGWFKYNTWDWPPPPNIQPIFTSFHATETPGNGVLGKWQAIRNFSKKSPSLITHELIEYYEKFQPIGCRDLATAQQFDSIHIENNFSGCLSLTLEPSQITTKHHILFVDPFGPLPPLNYRIDYWRRIPRSIRRNSIKLTHLYFSCNASKRFKLAQEYLDIYSKAKLVITSRLHCALPCMAFGIPTILVTTNRRSERLQGYENLLYTISHEDLRQPGVIEGLFDSTPKLYDISAIKRGLLQTCQDRLK